MLGRTREDLPDELRDEARLYASLTLRYQREYVDAWQRFLASVRYKPVRGSDAVARLVILGSATDSPERASTAR